MLCESTQRELLRGSACGCGEARRRGGRHTPRKERRRARCKQSRSNTNHPASRHAASQTPNSASGPTPESTRKHAKQWSKQHAQTSSRERTLGHDPREAPQPQHVARHPDEQLVERGADEESGEERHGAPGAADAEGCVRAFELGLCVFERGRPGYATGGLWARGREGFAWTRQARKGARCSNKGHGVERSGRRRMCKQRALCESLGSTRGARATCGPECSTASSTGRSSSRSTCDTAGRETTGQ